MERDVKESWVAALRSDIYGQTQQRLRSMNNYCCLGVLCDLLHPEGWRSSNEGWEHSYNQSMPGAAVMEESGLGDGDADMLAQMNDDGFTFEDIAAWIEENL